MKNAFSPASLPVTFAIRTGRTLLLAMRQINSERDGCKSVPFDYCGIAYSIRIRRF